MDATAMSRQHPAGLAVGGPQPYRAVREAGRRELFAVRAPGDAGDEAAMSSEHRPRLAPRTQQPSLPVLACRGQTLPSRAPAHEGDRSLFPRHDLLAFHLLIPEPDQTFI